MCCRLTLMCWIFCLSNRLRHIVFGQYSFNEQLERDESVLLEMSFYHCWQAPVPLEFQCCATEGEEQDILGFAKGLYCL